MKRIGALWVLALFFTTGAGAQAGQDLQSAHIPAAVHLGEVEHEADLGGLFAPDWMARHWDHGYFVQAQHDALPSKPAVTVFDREGQFVRDAVVWLANANNVHVEDVAVTPSGDLVVTGAAEFSHRVKGAFYSRYWGTNILFFLAEINAKGQMTKLLPLSLYGARNICTDSDGTVWTWGTEHPTFGGKTWDDLFPTLRHYSFSDGLLYDSGTQGKLPVFKSKGQPSFSSGIDLVCAAEFVGLYDGPGLRWVEYDRHSQRVSARPVSMLGEPAKQYRELVTGMAVTTDGMVCASITRRWPTSGSHAIYRLERGSANGVHWTKVGDLRSGMILGSDGDALVYEEYTDRPLQMRWSHVVAVAEKPQ